MLVESIFAVVFFLLVIVVVTSILLFLTNLMATSEMWRWSG